jgi:hypothetical protein
MNGTTMATDQSTLPVQAQQALEQLEQAIEENPDAVRQVVTDTITALRPTIANLTVKQKAEIAVAVRQLQTKAAEVGLKQQLEELADQLGKTA